MAWWWTTIIYQNVFEAVGFGLERHPIVLPLLVHIRDSIGCESLDRRNKSQNLPCVEWLLSRKFQELAYLPDQPESMVVCSMLQRGQNLALSSARSTCREHREIDPLQRHSIYEWVVHLSSLLSRGIGSSWLLRKESPCWKDRFFDFRYLLCGKLLAACTDCCTTVPYSRMNTMFTTPPSWEKRLNKVRASFNSCTSR